MSAHDDHPLLHATRIDIPLDIRIYLTTMLNQTLACTVDLRSQVKQATWNVKGHIFMPLRTLFDTMAVALDTYAEVLAERIAVLGGTARGTVRTVAAQSTLPDYPSDLVEGITHVEALAERCAHYAKEIRASIAHAADVEDMDTANIYTDISRGIDKHVALLEAYLYQ